LLLSLVVLAAVLAAELRFQVGTHPGGAVAGQGSAPATASPAPRFALADRGTFSETLTRPLFMPERRPPEMAAAESAEPVRKPARPQPNRYALSAIIIVDDEPVALLTDTATGASSRVREGERIAGWQVEAIREDSAVLTRGDTREELPLRTFAAPAPVVKSRTAPTGAQPKRPRRPQRAPRTKRQVTGSEAN
jgi:hypothetical protein